MSNTRAGRDKGSARHAFPATERMYLAQRTIRQMFVMKYGRMHAAAQHLILLQLHVDQLFVAFLALVHCQLLELVPDHVDLPRLVSVRKSLDPRNSHAVQETSPYLAYKRKWIQS